MRFTATIQDLPVLTPAAVDAALARLRARCLGLPIVLLYLHGSYARGTQTELSDIDIAVLLDGAAVGQSGVRLDVADMLADVFARDDVDIVFLNSAGPIIRDRVVRSGRLVFARSERERVRFEAAAVKECLDFEAFSRAYNDALFRQAREGRLLG